MGEYNRVIKYYHLSWKHKLATVKSLEADVLSISPSSERLEIKAYSIKTFLFYMLVKSTKKK